MSLDAGKTWINCRSRIKFPSESYFCMVGMARPEGSPYCYLLGTQSGNGYRLSAARLARVKPSDILDRDKYEYWNGTRRRWLKGSESLATDLLEARIGELSFMYNEKYGRWIVMYIDNTLGICYRTAPSVIGPWSDEKVLCPSSDSRYKGVYGSFMHPACMKADWDGDLYWTMSQWGPYNVFLMRASISYE